MDSSADLLRKLIDSAPDAMVITDEVGIIQFVNLQAERLFGYRRDELLDQPVEILLPERFRATHTEHREGFVNAPTSRPMGAGIELFGCRKDGSEFPAEISLSPLRTESGVLVSSAIRDVSDHLRTEQKFRALLESAPDAMVVVNLEGRIVLINAQAERVFGYQRAELLGQPIEMLIPKRFRSQHVGSSLGVRTRAEGASHGRGRRTRWGPQGRQRIPRRDQPESAGNGSGHANFERHSRHH